MAELARNITPGIDHSYVGGSSGARTPDPGRARPPVAGRGPTVFIGSYGGNLYAYDARTGRSRWTKALGGRVSGGITVVGDLVMYANLGRRTLGIRRAGDGALLYSHRSGAFDPGISDGRRLYIDTYTSVYHLVPPRQVRRDEESFRNAARRRRG